MRDACCDEETTDVTFMTSSQVGKTEIINNVLGYHIDVDACPIMVVLPTIDIGRAYSKDRLDPMIRDTEALRGKVATEGSRKKDNTVLHKNFPGGHVTISGANSPASLSSRPIRVVLCDEVDRYPYSAGEEGDPEALAFKRTQTFYNKKKIDTSTPTVKGLSRIENRYKAGNMQKYFVPCHKCGHCQELKWSQLKFKDSKKNRVEPYYQCEKCKAHWTEIQKRKNVARAEDVKGGGWIATNDKGAEGHQSFTIWEVYSPWSTMDEIVAAFYDSKTNPLKLQTFINTVLAESWEETGETLSSNKLFNRRERYPKDCDVPKEGLVLVAGVDIQKNRIEGEVAAFGRGEECYGIEYFVLMGDTEGDDVWLDLSEKLETQYRHESGHMLKIAAVGVDSGHHTNTVYAFCEERSMTRVWAVKGKGGAGVPIIAPPTKKKTHRVGRPVDLYIVGTDQAKSSIYSRLKLARSGPGFCHFHMDYPEAFFDGLTAEKALTVYTKGFPKIVWKKPAGIANEPLDIRVYQYAALSILNPVWSALEKRLESELPEAKDAKPVTPKKRKAKKKRRRHPGFVGGLSK